MKLILFLNTSAFYLAVDDKKIEIINLFLNNDKLDINLPYISNTKNINKIKKKLMFLWYWRLNISMKFKNIFK